MGAATRCDEQSWWPCHWSVTRWLAEAVRQKLSSGCALAKAARWRHAGSARTLQADLEGLLQ